MPADDATGPTVSIITPTLNQGDMIAHTIESVRDQTYRPVEHIVVDGGSTDGTLEVLSNSPNVTWTSEPDTGMYDAVNKGLRRARGQIVGYLNSDDRLAPWAVETAVRALGERPDVAVVFGDAVELSASGIELKLQVPFDPGRILRHGSLAQPAVFWRRELADRYGGFDARLQFVGDLDYWLRMSGTERFEHLDEVLAAYLIHPGSKSSRARVAMRAEEMAVRGAHGSGVTRVARGALLARLSHGLAVRIQIVRFVLAVRGRNAGWGRFRADGRPTVRPRQLIAAMLPLASRRPPTHWLGIRDGWLRESGRKPT